MLEKLVEGYFVTTLDNLIFEVKGVVHPNDRIIAYVRYVPNIVSSESTPRFQKLYELHEREKFLKDNFPEYLWFSETHERILQSVPYEKVKQILDPVEHMVQIRKDSSVLSTSTSRLVDLLLEYTGIDREDIGVTGSQLVGVATETSDIDLIVFGESACEEFYRKLEQNFDEIPGLERYSGNLLDKHLKFRWGDLVEHHGILREIERRKILQGVFEKHHLFIRLVKRRQDVTESFGQIVSENSESREVQCLVVDNQESIFTPCVYRVESSDYPELKQIISFRGRFTEHVSKGDFVKAKGRFEYVVDTSTDERYQQLVLGESSTDYLIPK
ncbi:MAG: nucleotidyltransferase domain-containing protein [Candidatus Thorarchaeota archaeon]